MARAKTNFIKGLFVAFVVVAAFVTTLRAEATTLNFALTGSYTANWTLDSDQVPLGTSPADGIFYYQGVSGLNPALYLTFSAASPAGFGGVRASTTLDLSTEVGAIFDLTNQLATLQIYSGTLDHPHFAPGSFIFDYDYLTADNSVAVPTTLTITAAPVAATPIPAALPLFVSALVGLGFFGWLRRNAAGAV
jgi:hypothetical protein